MTKVATASTFLGIGTLTHIVMTTFVLHGKSAPDVIVIDLQRRVVVMGHSARGVTDVVLKICGVDRSCRRGIHIAHSRWRLLWCTVPMLLMPMLMLMLVRVTLLRWRRPFHRTPTTVTIVPALATAVHGGGSERWGVKAVVVIGTNIRSRRRGHRFPQTPHAVREVQRGALFQVVVVSFPTPIIRCDGMHTIALVLYHAVKRACWHVTVGCVIVGVVRVSGGVDVDDRWIHT